MSRTVVTSWYGAFLFDGGELLRSATFPLDPAALRERLRARREGRLTPEEEALAGNVGPGTVRTPDRRYAALAGFQIGPVERAALPEPPPTVRAAWRSLLLEEAEHALRAAWDPSIHVEEAVRALADLETTLNLIGERVASWDARDSSVVEEAGEGSTRAVAQRIAQGATPPRGDVPGPDPDLAAARRELAQLYLEVERTRAQVEASVTDAMPRRAPNLSALLGPLLAARMLAQAGGLARMARLPASTIQVLGAERAFFEHLRGRAPPPRHGLLFLHPDLHSAPRKARGKLARALAGKAAIAARLDLEGSPVRADLTRAFEARRDTIRAAGRVPRGSRPKPPSRAPLDRAAEDR